MVMAFFCDARRDNSDFDGHIWSCGLPCVHDPFDVSIAADDHGAFWQRSQFNQMLIPDRFKVVGSGCHKDNLCKLRQPPIERSHPLMRNSILLERPAPIPRRLPAVYEPNFMSSLAQFVANPRADRSGTNNDDFR